MANFTPSPEPWLRHWLKLSLETLPGAEATERKKTPGPETEGQYNARDETTDIDTAQD